MKFEVIKNAVTSKAGRQILIGKKHSPVIMFGVGIAGTVGTVVLACRATLKVEEVLDEADKKRQLINTLQSEKYSENDRKKDNLYLTIQTVAHVCKLYAPAIGLGVVSVGLLTGSHLTLTRRNVAVTAAYKAVEESFNNYRHQVREDLGEEKELDYYRGVRAEEVHDTKKGVVDNKKRYINPGGGPTSPYSYYFGRNNVNWDDRPEYNLLFLRANQTWANNQLISRGHVMLNDVLDALGMERVKEGFIVGWVKNSNHDNEVDFGVFDTKNMDKFYDFVVGEDGLWLDFNVDGSVYDKI